MSCWGNRKPSASYVSKLDLTLCRSKADRFNSNNLLESPSRNQCFGSLSSFDDPVLKKNYADTPVKPRDFSGGHCSRIDITLEKKDRRKDFVNCLSCACVCSCSSSAHRLHMPWRYSSSCKDSQGSQTCPGQGGFAPDHGCGFTNSILKNQHSTKLQSNSCYSSRDDHVELSESFPSISKSKSSCTSRLDVVLSNNSTVSTPQSNKPTVFTSCNQEQPFKDYGENVTQMTNISGVKMYISSCSLTVHPTQSKCQGGNYAQSVLLMPPGEKASSEYAVGFQSPKTGFIMSETPTLQITQFQVTRSPANPPSLQQTSTREIWVSPESLPRVARSSGSPDLVPNVVVFQRSRSPITGRRTDLYPVLIPTQHKASKITLLIGSSVAPVPVQVIQEYSRCATPAIFISNGDSPTSPEDLGSGFLLSVNPLSCSKQRPMETQRSPPLIGSHPVRCKQNEPYLYHTTPCTVMPQLPSSRENYAPIAVSIETYGSRRGAVKISISHSRDPNN